MAQAVYSVNAVGYINLAMQPGFNLVANQLKASPNNSLNAVLTGVPLESQTYKFVNGNYVNDVFDGAVWLDNSNGDPSTTVLDPGQGFFFLNPLAAPATVTLVGEVPQGAALNVTLGVGFTLAASIVPQTLPLTPANGFLNVQEMEILTYDALTQNYNHSSINDGTGAWFDNTNGDPIPAPIAQVGQGFFVLNPTGSAVQWTRAFSVNP